MPRIDNSNIDVQEWYEFKFNEADPGDTPPVDVCMSCYIDLWRLDGIEFDHPPYEDDPDHPYHCRECDIILTNQDNGDNG